MRRFDRRSSAPPFALVLIALAGAGAAAENIDPAGDDHQYAWGENVGWINAEPSGDGGPGVEVGDFALTGWMWGENVGWISLSCTNTGSCASTSYAVLNDGFGRLSGFAWGENVGWINFAPVACLPDPTCGVRIDPATGYFAGRAWSENTGWLTFSSNQPLPSTARTSWCQSLSGPPAASTGLTLARSAGAVTLSWSPVAGASWYDVVRGSLSALRASRGNFALATDRCVRSRLAGLSHVLAEPDPPPGHGVWFLVRGANCRGRGTYDSGSASQVGTRDLEIATSGTDCP